MYDSPLINVNGNQVPTLDILLMLTVISLLPSLLIMVTSFARTVIILSFLRNAIGVQQTPPNMVIVGIAIFLTLFIMDPVIKEINTQAYTPYKNQEISQEEAIARAQIPLKEFMLTNTEKSSLNMYVEMSGNEEVEEVTELPMTVIIPSFITSELKKGFTAGFLLYIDVHGYDDAAAGDDLYAVQAASVRNCGWMAVVVLNDCEQFPDRVRRRIR